MTTVTGQHRIFRPNGAIWLLSLVILLVAPLVAPVAWAPAQAQAAAPGLIRDAEIENTLKRIAAPLLRAAGMGSDAVELLVVNDPSLNAFVIDGRAIFLNEGLIRRLARIDMLQAVIAHELAHITAGHLVRRRLGQRDARTAIGLGALLGLAVTSATGNADAGGGIMLGTMTSAVGRLLAHTRAEETTADQIGVRYMVRAGIDPRGALDVMEIFRGQEALAPGRQDPYSRTHPLSSARISALKAVIAAYGGRKTAPDPDLAYRHGRMRAKFRGFVGNPAYILRHLDSRAQDEATIMTRAIALHRQGRRKAALAAMGRLTRLRPDDAYYRDLQGQILLEGGDPRAAVAAWRKAVALAPREPLILAGLGRALLALKAPGADREALSVLRRARQMDGRDARMLRDLAVAWARAGNDGMASLVTAERYALLTRFKSARTNAERAAALLPRGSGGWLRAQDIMAAMRIALGK